MSWGKFTVWPYDLKWQKFLFQVSCVCGIVFTSCCYIAVNRLPFERMAAFIAIDLMTVLVMMVFLHAVTS